MALNNENEICLRCGKPTVPLFANGRKRWCPICEASPPKKKKQLDLFEIGSDKDRDEITVKRSPDDSDPWGWTMTDPKKYKGKI